MARSSRSCYIVSCTDAEPIEGPNSSAQCARSQSRAQIHPRSVRGVNRGPKFVRAVCAESIGDPNSSAQCARSQSRAQIRPRSVREANREPKFVRAVCAESIEGPNSSARCARSQSRTQIHPRSVRGPITGVIEIAAEIRRAPATGARALFSCVGARRKVR